MTDILKRLYDKDNKAAYETAKQIGAESALTEMELCRYQDTMLPLIEKDAAALRNLL